MNRDPAAPRGSSIAGLPQKLRQASTAELLTLVDTHGQELGLREVRQVLLNPFTTGAVLDALLTNRRLSQHLEIRSAVCRDPRTPQHSALRLLANLFWRDLVEISRNARISPAVRRAAERTLRQRLPRLASGERITLARRATAAVLVELFHDPNPRVISALLDNPRLDEETVVRLVADRGLHPKMLLLVSQDLRWGRRYEVRNALCRNPQAPFGVQLELLETLMLDDLETIAAQEDHSSVVRQRAAELVEGRRTRPRSDGVEAPGGQLTG